MSDREKLEVVEVMPKSGQFVAVWVYSGQVWSGTYMWDDSILYTYDEASDMWGETPENGCQVMASEYFVVCASAAEIGRSMP